jgi:hypothetical protein
MKKLTGMLIGASILFASNVNYSTINQKLDIIIQKLNKIEHQLQIKNQEIKKLQVEIKKQQQEIQKQAVQTKKELAIKSCDGIKVLSLKHQYYNEIIPYYMLTITLKNTYPYTVTYLRGDLIVEDKHRTKVLVDFIDRKVNLKPGETITFTQKHILNSGLEKYLRTMGPKDMILIFQPTEIIFKGGKRLECN